MAIVQLRNQTEGRTYFDRRKAAGKTSMEAMRSLKRRLSDIVYRTMIVDAIGVGAGPGGQRGNDSDSSAAGLPPHTGTSEKPHPGPAAPSLRPALPAAS
jgi:transposase